MSFNKLNYDTCSYKQALSESVGPCEYQSVCHLFHVKTASQKTHN